MTLTAATSPPDYAAFLRDQYALQTPNVASYRLGPEQVWLKKAGPRHSMARYRVLGLLAWLTRLQVLRPVPNLGGSTAIATEARRLHSLAALGLRVPEVLAQQPEGLLLRHLGRPGEATPSFGGEQGAQCSGLIGQPVRPDCPRFGQCPGLAQIQRCGVHVAQRIACLAQRQRQAGQGVVFEVDEAQHTVGATHQVAGKGLAQASAARMHGLQRGQPFLPPGQYGLRACGAGGLHFAIK